MLVLSRKVGEEVVIGGDIAITVVGAGRRQVRLGFTAPREVPIHRKELLHRDREMTELLLLMPCGQVGALQAEARNHGITVGQMICRLVGSFLHPGD